ncbi:MAG: transketolase [Thermodesulfobacteria bacterium]|nr:transketolase [Thermodesulfobacteriota bacterium]
MFKIDVTSTKELSSEQLETLAKMWQRCAARIIISTTLAKSGHPGGSLSSLHTLLLLYAMMKHDPSNPDWEERDKFVVSIGHISPGVYGVLSEYGYFPEEDFLTEFRRAGSAFGGHVEQGVPGIEWNTGNLGQGLSAADGFALSAKLAGRKDARTFCLMGDGEQQKGQVAEARRFAVKYGLKDLICIIDRNHLQIGGSTEEVMPVRVRDEYKAAGWNVVYVADGNDFQQLYKGLRRAFLHEDLDPERPVVVVSRTIMGKGISFMENKEKYHGSPLPEDQARQALSEIGLSPSLLDEWKKKREAHTITPVAHSYRKMPTPHIEPGEPIVYDADTITDCRSAYGNALKSLAEANNQPGQVPKILGFSCDLEGSVKMKGFHSVSPDAFFEVGIQEHHAAVCSAVTTRDGFVSFFSTFGVFAVCETYNQHRLSDQNQTNLKVVSTHNGLDVGEDGPTHQCIDYIGLMENLFGFSIFMPADPNQTDRIVRYVATTTGNCFVGMGRSKMPMVLDLDGKPFFGKDYEFIPGKADWLRRGKEGSATIISYGATMPYVMKAWERLQEMGIQVSVLNMASIKPVDEEAIIEAAKNGPLLTVEDHVVTTGIGSITARVLVQNGISQKLRCLGVKRYGESGKPADLYRMHGIDTEAIVEAIKNI